MLVSLNKNNVNINKQNPKKAYNSVILPKHYSLLPSIPEKNNFKINVIKTDLPGIVTFKEVIEVKNKGWYMKIKLNNHEEIDKLMNLQEYEKLTS